MSSFDGLFSLVETALDQPTAHWLREHVEVPRGLLAFSWNQQAVHRAWLAEGLNLCLLHKLVEAVPEGRRYVEEQAQHGRKVVFDHGAEEETRAIAMSAVIDYSDKQDGDYYCSLVLRFIEASEVL